MLSMVFLQITKAVNVTFSPTPQELTNVELLSVVASVLHESSAMLSLRSFSSKRQRINETSKACKWHQMAMKE